MRSYNELRKGFEDLKEDLPYPEALSGTQSERDRLVYCAGCYDPDGLNEELIIKYFPFTGETANAVLTEEVQIWIYPFEWQGDKLFCILSKRSKNGYYRFWQANGGYSEAVRLIEPEQDTSREVQDTQCVPLDNTKHKAATVQFDRQRSPYETRSREKKSMQMGSPTLGEDLLEEDGYQCNESLSVLSRTVAKDIAPTRAQPQYEAQQSQPLPPSVALHKVVGSIQAGEKRKYQTNEFVTGLDQPRPKAPRLVMNLTEQHVQDESIKLSSSSSVRDLYEVTPTSHRLEQATMILPGPPAQSIQHPNENFSTSSRTLSGRESPPKIISPPAPRPSSEATNTNRALVRSVLREVGLSELQIRNTTIVLQLVGDPYTSDMSLEGCHSVEDFFSKISKVLGDLVDDGIKFVLIDSDIGIEVIHIRIGQAGAPSFRRLIRTIASARCWNKEQKPECEIKALIETF
ncbi:hypothetical protein H2199_008808 [Coniosporium tulheliwenetii]|uniref:Uncharacterized protein n=1 Tax=Coniosporium tulheliwenetii TaxID=3383036 RepID=A0ACC2YHT5_9PEZI|nr:hypothetical protein H2199_008808 [Cladosporium sp. JES 115]